MSKTERPVSGTFEKPNVVLESRGQTSSPTRKVALAIAMTISPLVAFSLAHYTRYGFRLFLGWDTTTYVWWAELVYERGPLSLILQGYPNLYILTLAALGTLLGSASIAERILPFVVSIPLAYAYYRLGSEIASNQKIGYLGALLGGVTINTIRLFSDLHRNLLAFSLSMAVGALVSSRLSSKPFSWGQEKKRALLLWLPMLTIVAYTQIETYVVLALTLLLLFSTTRDTRTAIVGAMLVATPILVALPLIWHFLLNYEAALRIYGIPASPPIILGEGLLFLGGLALPGMAVGLVDLVRKARFGSQSAHFLVLWLVAIALLFPVGFVLGLPIFRLFYIVPVPLLTVLSIPPSVRYGPRLARMLSLKRLPFLRIRTRFVKGYAIPSAAMALVLTATLLTSVTTSDLFLRPYVSQADVSRLLEAAEIVRSLGYDQPILVMYGQTAADLNPIYRAYFGIEIPSSLAYYGKLQYVFSLPPPKDVYNWQYNPPFEQANSVKYRTEILAQLGTYSAVGSHPIVIVGGKTYDRPLSESFITKFERAPGIYIIPPNGLTPQEIDSWRLYASSDWTNTTSVAKANATWSMSPTILNWAEKSPKSRFEANFTISLARSWPTMELKLRFYDWPQPFIFPDSSTVALSPLEVYFDDALILFRNYAGQGPSFINGTMVGVNSGVHHIRIKSWSLGLGVAVALDEIQVCPSFCQS